MEDYPRTLADFEKRFRSEEACRDYLFRVRWPEGFAAPVAGKAEGGGCVPRSGSVRAVRTKLR